MKEKYFFTNICKFISVTFEITRCQLYIAVYYVHVSIRYTAVNPTSPFFIPIPKYDSNSLSICYLLTLKLVQMVNCH